jgi:hypothetical protein
MNTRELERVEVMGRVAHKELKLTDAAAMLELSYRQVKAAMAALQADGAQRVAAWECGSSLQSQQARQISAPSAELDQAEIFRFRRGAIRPDLGSGAPDRRRRDHDQSRDLTWLDDGRRAVESPMQAEEAL